MSTNSLGTRRWRGAAASSVAAALLLAAAAAGQPPSASDYLDQVRRREEVARQKIEVEVRTTLRTVQHLTLSNPAQALERLKALLTLLDNDTVLTKDRRERLQRMVKDRIRVTELEHKQALANTAAEKDQQTKTAVRRLREEQQAAERERLRREIEGLRQKQGRGQKPHGAAGRNPVSPAGQASNRIDSVRDQVAATRRHELDRQRGLAGVRRELDRSSTPPLGDVEFPRDWKERTKGRHVVQPLSPKEKAILAALSTPVTVNFKNSRFDDVIEYLQTLIGQPILVEPTALKEAEVTYETPITLNAKGVTVRTALRKILAELNLAYIIKEETIQVTTLQRARESMVVRTYPVGDLAIAFRPDRGPFLGPFVTPAEMLKNVDDMMRLIQASVDPASWQLNGGTGTIAFHAPSLSLVVKATAEVHLMLGRGSGSK